MRTAFCQDGALQPSARGNDLNLWLLKVSHRSFSRSGYTDTAHCSLKVAINQRLQRFTVRRTKDVVGSHVPPRMEDIKGREDGLVTRKGGDARHFGADGLGEVAPGRRRMRQFRRDLVMIS